MKKLYLIIFLISFLSALSEEDFLKTLNEVSEIATNTKLNIDKTPSNVDIIDRDFIEKSGARTLLDLLKYLPGIEISMSASGKREIIVRGNKSTFRDKIKFLINGHEITNNLYSNQFYYYNFPAHLIKRIEFTKTPDAVLYGDKAYLGVINIITLNELDDNQFSFYQSSKKQTTATLFNKLSENTLIDAHYLISDPSIKKIRTYLVDVTKYQANLVRETRPNELEKEAGVGIKYKKDKSTFSYRFQYFQKGNFFGVVNLPPLKQDKHINFIHQFINYNYSKFLTGKIKNSFDIGIKHYEWKGSFRILPIDFNFSNPDSDLVEGAIIKEYEFYAKDRITYNSEKHIINLIFEAKYSKPYKSDYFQYVLSNKTILNLFSEDVKRRIFSVSLEDLVILRDNLSIIYGGRYSNYNDFGSDISYKIGGVYNLNDKTTFKLLFNTAFRAPSWIELYSSTAAAFNGNPSLKAEKIKMLEISYLQKIFKNDRLKFTIYRGESKNYIGRKVSLISGKRIYENLGDYVIKGFEISYKKYYKKGNFNINYSYNNNKANFSSYVENIDFYKYLGIRNRLIKGYNIYNINSHFSFFSGLIYGSKIKIPYIDPSNEYFSLNTNINYHKNNFNLIIGVDNLTNHPNSYLSMPSDLIKSKYFFIHDEAKMPLEGRKIYISLIKKW